MRLTLVTVMTLSALGISACQPNTQTATESEGAAVAEVAQTASTNLETEAQKQAYALGKSKGMYVKNRSDEQNKNGIEFSGLRIMGCASSNIQNLCMTTITN